MNGRDRVDELLRAEYELARASIAGEASRYGFIVHQLTDAIARDLDAPIRWRPIADAPKDGTEVLVYRDGFLLKHYFARLDDGLWVTRSGMKLTPTHFAELKGPDHG